MSDMKLIIEGWRGFLNEAEEGPTVGQFLASWQKQNPKSMQKILGKAAKWVVGLSVGAAVGAAAGGVTGGVGAGLGGAAGIAAGKLSEEAVNQLFGLVAGKSGDLAKFMISMSERQVPDDERSGIDLYYDIDDEYEALLQGMDSELANAYQEKLFAYFKGAFSTMGDAEPGEPLKDYITMTANQFLQRFLKKSSWSGVGVQVVTTRSEE